MMSRAVGDDSDVNGVDSGVEDDDISVNSDDDDDSGVFDGDDHDSGDASNGSGVGDDFCWQWQ